MILCSSNPSEDSNYIVVLAPWISIIIAVVLWFLSSERDRKQERFKKYLDRRIDTLEEAIRVLFLFDVPDPFQKTPNLVEQVESVRSKIQIFGTDEEVKLFEEFIKKLEHKNIEELRTFIPQLRRNIANSYRHELGLPLRFKTD